MSYINQDPDINIPFKGKEMIAVTRFAWMQERELEETLDAKGLSSACWCGCVPGACGDCQDMESLNPMVAVGKINIGSGEDYVANM